MAEQRSDAIVFFGATGDLAYKQIFPSLLGLVRDEGLNVAVIGVAKAGWNLDQLKARAADSLQHHGLSGTPAAQRLIDAARHLRPKRAPNRISTQRQRQSRHLLPPSSEIHNSMQA